MELRPLRTDESELLKEALLRTARWRELEPTVTLDSIEAQVPMISRYYVDFGRHGDYAGVAETDNRVSGAVWYRLFTSAEPGFGFVDEATPELGIAIWPGFRGQGLGGQLLDSLLEQAAKDGFGQLSLSVGKENAVARRLYDSRGFKEALQHPNSVTMVASTVRR